MLVIYGLIELFCGFIAILVLGTYAVKSKRENVNNLIKFPLALLLIIKLLLNTYVIYFTTLSKSYLPQNVSPRSFDWSVAVIKAVLHTSPYNFIDITSTVLIIIIGIILIFKLNKLSNITQ